MHVRFLALAALVALLSPAAQGALLRYELREFSLAHFENSSPHVFYSEVGAISRALVDESGSEPVLRKLLIVTDDVLTILVPQLAGFVWIANSAKEGPTGEFTGTGSTTSAITWGTLTGWSITGGTFCNAMPSFVCDLAVSSHLVTAQPDLRSTFYDIGTWVFHGTGFTSNGFIYFTSTMPGNQQVVLKGVEAATGTVPALPVLGVGALGASLFAMGLAALRRRAG